MDNPLTQITSVMKALFLGLALIPICLSCTEKETFEPDAIKGMNGVEWRSENGPPAMSGPIVTRAEESIFEIGFIMPDPKTNLTAIVGVDMEALCGEVGLLIPDILPLQDILTPSREGRIIRLQKGEVSAFVYEGIWESGFVCDFAAGTNLVAEGMARINITDNDLVVYLTDTNKNRNSANYKVHGFLEDNLGNTVRLNAHHSIIWDGTNDETLKVRSKVQVIQ